MDKRVLSRCGRLALIVPPLSIVTVLLLVAPTGRTAQEGDVDSSQSAIISGTPISAEESGTVFVRAGGLCSGTLLTNNWVITAAHCALDIANPANNSISMGSQTATGAFAVNHPSLDFALIRLATPLRMNGSAAGYRALLYTDTTASLNDKVLTCRGYGCNKYTVPASADDPFVCSGMDGTLREAQLAVKSDEFDDYNFALALNSKGQLLGPGDSGTGCFVRTTSGLALAGIQKSGTRNDQDNARSFLGRPENWREWALAYVEGRPVPLPAQWHVSTASPDTFLKRPLADRTSGSHSWQPCPGSASYEYTPRYELEKGRDFVTLMSQGTTTRLNGRGGMQCFGRGPIAVTVQTDNGNPSAGVTAMPITCGRAPPANSGPGCSFLFGTASWTGAWGSDGPINVGDLNGDDKTDVFMSRDSDHSWMVNLSTGSGFNMQRWTGAWGSDGPINVGDLNGDGKTDVFMSRNSDHSWMVNLSTGSGFNMQRWTGAWGSDGPINVGDLNGDGKTDVFMSRNSDHSWMVNLSTGSGFNMQRWTGAWGSDGPINVGDLNGDGKTDVFMWRNSDQSWMVNLSTGSGFNMQRWTGAWGSDGPINVGDLNGDGKTDVFMWRNSDQSWMVNLSTGSGFNMQRWTGAWGSDGPINVGDLNGDGKTDVFMWRNSDKHWTVNISTGSGFDMQRWVGTWGSDGPIRIGDLNGDGKADIFISRDSDHLWLINLSP